MTVRELRSNLHQLIERIENEELLSAIHDLLMQKKESKEGKLFNSLSEEQERELLASEKKSHDESTLIDNDEVMKKYKKWL